MKKIAKELLTYLLIILLCIFGLFLDVIYFIFNDIFKGFVNRFKTLKLWADETI